MKALGVLVVLLLALTACGSDGSDDSDASPTPSSTPSSTPSAAPPSAAVELAETDVCALVREGIDAFNVGDLDGTIAKFADAVPLAEDLAEEQPSDDTETLLDAVRYYAELPAEDYVEDSVSSPEFLRFKDFTLIECAYAGPPDGATDPAIPA